jgi:hypothetical protein
MTTKRLLFVVFLSFCVTGYGIAQKGPFWSVVTYSEGEVYILEGDEVRTTHPFLPREHSAKPWVLPSARELRVIRQSDGMVVLDRLTHRTLQPAGLTHSVYEYFPSADLAVAGMETTLVRGTDFTNLRNGRTTHLDASFRNDEVNAHRPFALIGTPHADGRTLKYSYAIFDKLSATAEKLTPEASAFIGGWLDTVVFVSRDRTLLLQGEVRVPSVQSRQKTATLFVSAWDLASNELLLEGTPLVLPPFRDVNLYEIHCIFARGNTLVVIYGEPARGSVREAIFSAHSSSDRSLWSSKGKFKSVQVYEDSANVITLLGEAAEMHDDLRHFELEQFDVVSAGSLHHRSFDVPQGTKPY